MKMTSYKLMFVLGVFDVVQCLPHLVTGVFTIRQSVFHPTLAKSMGVLATPAYVAYTVLTVVLAINRFLQIYSPRLDSLLFNSSAVRVSCIFIAVFVSATSFLILRAQCGNAISLLEKRFLHNINKFRDM
ncbi:unnamed protein product [Heligmosomoides polygyrus]|uniref:G protein-coupled receptor n=1 Tax=Heligmosomoides polygyrus TaxID=6339 RepID=A0A183G2H0_HELPZ|nr:unnamed protein product [Heligmosomoides polygyrus]